VSEAAPPHPSFAEVTRVFLRIGLLSFGGPAGQIALMHRVLVDEKKWVSEPRFLTALNFCMLLPGPEAQQLATYIGWLLHGWRGGVVAGSLFVIPGFLVILALSAAYGLYQDTDWVTGLFFGLKAAVLVIVVEALVRVSRRALKNGLMRAIAVLAFLALVLFDMPFPIVILAAGVAGFVGARGWPQLFGAPSGGADSVPNGREARTGPLRALGVILAWGGLWLAPLIVILPLAGWDSVFADIFRFFSLMAVVTFGGAYAVLAYVAQEAVTGLHWLQPGEMIDGLALAETTPGPLVLVLSFVGFLAAARHATGLDPVLAGMLGATLVTWVTFVPCFLWIFLGAPHVERLSANRALSGALAAITAAVVGVIASLALWFALHTLFRSVGRVSAGPLSIDVPDLLSLDLVALGLAVVAALLLFGLRAGLVPTLAVAAALGLAANWLL
jgi:chromate transporter